MVLVVEMPSLDDVPDMVALFRADLLDLNLQVDDDQLAETAERLVNTMDEHCYLRIVRPSAGMPAAGVIVAHQWTSVKFAGRAFWLETLYVNDQLRRQGLGRTLVQQLIDYATDMDCRGIDLEAYRMNAPASYLYRSLGFRRLGRERYSLDLTD
jgi:ribosomal protein S18 acetylase RimI-like enzyme